MWEVKGKPEQMGVCLTPDQILYEYDGPRIFTCKDSADNLYLAYLCDEDASCSRFLVVAFSQSLLEDLTSGNMNMRDALSRPRAWLIDLDNDWRITQTWRIEIEGLPADTLPKPGVMLWRHLPPIINPIVIRAASNQFEVNYPELPTFSGLFRIAHA